MIILLTIVHVVVCLFLIIVVLLQSGKAADLAGAFGGMGSQTAFGPRGAATVLSKATTISAALFMLTSLSLSVLYTRAGHGQGASAIDNTKSPVTKQQPAPAQQAPALPANPALPATKSAPAGGNVVDIPIDKITETKQGAPAQKGAPAAQK
jgi:preprotein translocase subunit SecG